MDHINYYPIVNKTVLTSFVENESFFFLDFSSREDILSHIYFLLSNKFLTLIILTEKITRTFHNLLK